MQSWREEKNTQGCEQTGRLPAPPQGHELPFPYSFSPHSATGLRKHRVGQLGTFVHTATCRETEYARLSITTLFITARRADHLDVMLGRQEE